MKKKLIKMRVCLGFDCYPRLDVVIYEDELFKDGRPYQSSKGVRNEKTVVDFGQIWVSSNSSDSEPYWDSYMILDGDTKPEDMQDMAKALYESSINAMKEDLTAIVDRVNEMQPPSPEEIAKEIASRTATGRTANGKYVIPVDKFKELIYQKSLEAGKEIANNVGADVAKWEEFYAKTLTPDVMSLLMKGLPVLKFTGNGIEFQTQEMFNQSIEVVIKKVSGDVFARFMETMKN